MLYSLTSEEGFLPIQLKRDEQNAYNQRASRCDKNQKKRFALYNRAENQAVKKGKRAYTRTVCRAFGSWTLNGRKLGGMSSYTHS